MTNRLSPSIPGAAASPPLCSRHRTGPIWARAALIAVLLVSVAASGCSQGGQTWDRIEREGILRVGLDPTYPPFEDAEGKPLEGLDVDLAHSIGAALGLEVVFVHFGFDGLYDALATGQVDVLLSAIVVSPERTRDFAYSMSYFNAGQILIFRQESPVNGPSDLAGDSLAVELGAQAHVIATEWQRQVASLDVQAFETSRAAVEAVAASRADAAIVDGVSGRLLLRESPSLALSPKSLTEEPYALVVRVEDTVLLARLNAALEGLRASGQLSLITERWLGG